LAEARKGLGLVTRTFAAFGLRAVAVMLAVPLWLVGFAWQIVGLTVWMFALGLALPVVIPVLIVADLCGYHSQSLDRPFSHFSVEDPPKVLMWGFLPLWAVERLFDAAERLVEVPL
jgi:hypothetical protein